MSLEREELMNILSECNKLDQWKCTNMHDRVGRVIHQKLCKQLKLHHVNKGYEQKVS